jgi:signal transduction histidine kinase
MGIMGWSPMGNSLTIVGLALLVWGITSEVHPGLGGRRLLALVLLAIASGGWIAWATRRLPKGLNAVSGGGLALMAAAGGALSPLGPLALVFVGVSALGAGLGWGLRKATAVDVVAVAATLISAAALDHSFSVLVGAAAAALAGTVTGVSRRESLERVEQQVLWSVERERADLAAARAELLGERNQLARELHDVLAHTLAALSLQLEALDATVEGDGGQVSPAVAEQIDKTKRLVREGLSEARIAVRALREDSAPLADQLAQLAAERSATFSSTGEVRRLPPPVTLALYRAAQEGLTNVMKHAPGADTGVELSFGEGRVAVSVINGRPAEGGEDAGLATSGGGFGLAGIKERLLLLGGEVEAGPFDSGWRLVAEVPA